MPSTEGSPSAVKEPGKLTVVVGDDDDGWRFLVRTRLREAGLDVVGEAATAEETLDLVRQLSPDVLVLDLHMPSRGGGGMRVLETVISERPDTHVIVTSADDRHRRYVRSRGADWVAKDEGLHALVAVVEEWARSRA